MTRSLRTAHQTRAGRRVRRGLALALAAIGLAGPLRADEIAWDNTSGDFLWSTPANWTPDALPAAADTLLFTDTGAGTINLGGLTRTAAGLTLDTDTSAYTFSNGTLQLPRISQTAGSATFNTPITAPAGLFLDVQAGTLNLLGPVTAAGLTKTGDGTAILSSATTALTGTTNLNAGRLLVKAANAFNTGTVNLAGGALQLQSTGVTFVGTYNVLADSTLIASRASGTGGTTIIPSLTLGDSTLSISTLNGQTLKANALTVNGTGAATIRTEGTVELLKMTLNDDLTLSGAGGGTIKLLAGSGSVTMNGTGSYVIAKEAVSTFAGTVTVNSGTLTAGSTFPMSQTRFTVNSGGILNYWGSTTSTGTVIDLKGGALTMVTAGSGTVINGFSGTVSALTGAQLIMQPGGTITATGLNGAVLAADGLITLRSTTYGDSIGFGGTITATTNLSLHMEAKHGASEHSVSEINLGSHALNVTSSGSTSLEMDKLTLSGPAQINAATPVKVWNCTVPSTLTVAGPSPVSLNTVSGTGSIVLNGPGEFGAGGNFPGTITVNGGTLRRLPFSAALTINTGGTGLLDYLNLGSKPVTLSGGSLLLYKDRVGYTGAASVVVTADSTLGVSNTSSSPYSPPIVDVKSLALSGHTLTLTNADDAQLVVPDLSLSAASTLRSQGRIVGYYQEPAARIDRATLSHPLTVTGEGTISLSKLSGSGNVIMNGTGKLSIVGTKNNDSRNWTGQLVMNSGTVALAGDFLYESLATGTEPLVVNDGATLAVDGIASVSGRYFTRPLHLSGLGSNGGGALSYNSTLAGAVIAAPVMLNGPTGIHVPTRPYWASYGTYGGLEIGRADAPAYGGAALTGTGPLVKLGGREDVGSLEINVAATYTGGTIIEAGAIIVGSSGSLVNTGPITVNPTGVIGVSRPAGNDPATNSVNPNSVSLKGGALMLIGAVDPHSVIAPDSTGGGIYFAKYSYASDLNLSRLVEGVPGSAWHLGGSVVAGGMRGSIRFDEPETLVLGGAGVLRVYSDLKAADNIAAVTVRSGLIRLSGSNDYAGDTQILAGELRVYGDQSVGTSTAPILLGSEQPTGDAAALVIADGATFSRDVLVRAGATGSVALKGTSGGGRLTGNITLNRDISLRDVPLALEGSISGVGGVTFDTPAAGTFTISGDNSYTGPTLILGTTVDASTTNNRTLGNSASITIQNGSDRTILRVRGPQNYGSSAVFNIAAGCTLGIASNVVPPIDPTSSGILGVDTDVFDAVTSLAALGNGNMRLGSTTSGTFTGTTLTPCTDNTYRLGGGGGTLTLPRPVLVGTAKLDVFRGQVVLYGDNTYGGATRVYSGILTAGDNGRVLGSSRYVTVSAGGVLRLAATSNYASNAQFTVENKGVLAVGNKFLPTMVSSSSGIFAIDTEGYDLVTNLAALGNGSMSYSSSIAGTLSSPTLLPGSGNVYRFGGGRGRLTVLADLVDAPGAARSVQIGPESSSVDTSVTILAGNNSYTGGTKVLDGTLIVAGRITGNVELDLRCKLGFMADNNLSLVTGTTDTSIDVGENARVQIARVTGIRAKTGEGTLDIGTYVRGSGAFTQSGGRTIFRGNTVASMDIRNGTVEFAASQQLFDLLVDETAPDARAIVGANTYVRVYGPSMYYGNSMSDGMAPPRYTIERLWTDISTGFGQGKSGIDLDPSVDRNTHALGLLMVLSPGNEPHALIKALLRGDIDGSGAVDEADALVMLASFSQPAESATSFTWIEGDLTYDGLLNEFDVGELAWAMDYPFDPAAGLAPAMDALRSMVNVPEPATLLLLPLALLTLTRRRLRS